MADEEQSAPIDQKPDTYKLWCARISKMRKVREQWEKDYKVKKCEQFYLGNQWDNDKGPRVMNHYLATIRVTQPNLLFDNPKVLVRPKPGHEQDARQKASLGENLLQQIMIQDDNFEEAAGFGLLQSFWRIGCLKVIYDPTLVPNPSYKGENTPIMQYDKDGNPMLDAETGQHQPVMDGTGQPVMEPPLIVSDETYRFEWVPAEDMLLPDAGPYMKKWPYLGQEIITTLAKAKADDRFPRDLRDQFKSNIKTDKRGKVKARTKQEDDEFESESLFKYVELYDLDNQMWYCIAEDQAFKEPIYQGSLPDGIEDHPYAILPGYLPITGPEPSPWPCPYTYSWLDPQEEYNIRRQQGMEGAKRSARKIFYDQSTFAEAEEALKALQSSRDMEAVKITDVTRPPVAVPDPPLPPTINQDIPLLLNDFRIIAGQPGAKLGTPDADTATEAAIVQRNSDLRDSDMQKAVQKWLRTALRKMFQLVRATLTVEMAVKITAMTEQQLEQLMMSQFGVPPQIFQMIPALLEYVKQAYGQQRVEKITREQINFEADIDVMPGSTKPRSLTSERAQLLEFLQIIAKAPQLLLSRLLLEELAAKYEFLNPALVDELQILAQRMMMANAMQAGHAEGGGGTATENTQGGGPSATANANSQADQLPM